MPYCSPSNVRYLVTTPLSDSEIADLIEESDAEIDRRLGMQEASNMLVRRISALVTAKVIRSTYPGSVAVGEYQESEGGTLTDWSTEIERIYRLLSKPKISAGQYGSFREDERYPEEG
jgi:hypothetical protein